MADEVDKTGEKSELLLDADIQQIRNRSANMPVGVPGECDKCGNDSKRLVGGYCAPCRDKYKFP